MLTMTGTLERVWLFNFSLEPERLRVPPPLELDLLRGTAILSLVVVGIRGMRPKGTPRWAGIDYHHVAYRILVKGGLYFPMTFADHRLICAGGNWFTVFPFEPARVRWTANRVRVAPRLKGHGMEAELGRREGARLGSLFRDVEEARRWIGPRIRALRPTEKGIRRVEVQRDAWPLEPSACVWANFEHLRRLGARLEIVFRVPHPIEYSWRSA